MTAAEAKRILHPDTTIEALAEIEYYGGLSGKNAKIAACDEACLVACVALDKQIPKECVRTKNNPINYNACPICCERVSDNYCPNCGQAIDWGVDDL